MTRTRYRVRMKINGRKISEVIIDQHYTESHPEMNDFIILKLILLLNERKFRPDKLNGDFSYYKVEPIFYMNKPFRMIFLLHEKESYLGIINAFRVRIKNEE